MWNKERKKLGNGTQELDVRIHLENLCHSNLSADRFIDSFKDCLKRVRKQSCYLAEFLYLAEKIDENTIEIWKLTGYLDKKYLMYILTKGPDDPDPFAHL